MSTLEQAVETQIKNIQAKTGKTLAELAAMVQNSGLSKHSEIREMFQRELGLGHGDANSLTHAVQQSDGTRAAAAKGLSGDAVLDEMYTGPKATLRPIHERLMKEIIRLGTFEIVPKKGYVSLRRKKQFAMLDAWSCHQYALRAGAQRQRVGGKPQTFGATCGRDVQLQSKTV